MAHTFAHLHYKYNWQAEPGDSLFKIGEPARNTINRKDGYDVLHFIRSMMVDYGWKNQATGEKIECMIHCCPPQHQTAHQLRQWICENWKNF